MNEPTKILIFVNAAEAREYRHEHGTGGWIFDDTTANAAILFPPFMSPSAIFHHFSVRHHEGTLIGNG